MCIPGRQSEAGGTSTCDNNVIRLSNKVFCTVDDIRGHAGRADLRRIVQVYIPRARRQEDEEISTAIDRVISRRVAQR